MKDFNVTLAILGWTAIASWSLWLCFQASMAGNNWTAFGFFLVAICVRFKSGDSE